MLPSPSDAAIFAIERPHPQLLKYYLLSSAVIPPLFPFIAIPMWFRYHTMRYRFTDEGISMSWGILFRREVIIQYARIQDIHLRSNVVERWLGLARVLVQTASGNASAEMTLEGLLEYEAVRDFLYARMRGVKDRAHSPASAASTHAHATATMSPATHDELTATLREVAGELRQLRESLASSRTPSPSSKEAGHV
jgi:putative membrane protein